MDLHQHTTSQLDADATRPPGRLARFVAWFGRTPDPVEGDPFRDSDFESDSSFFGARPYGEH